MWPWATHYISLSPKSLKCHHLTGLCRKWNNFRCKKMLCEMKSRNINTFFPMKWRKESKLISILLSRSAYKTSLEWAIKISVYQCICSISCRGWKVSLFIPVVLAVMKAAWCKAPGANQLQTTSPCSHSHYFFIWTILFKVGQHLGHTNPKVPVD